MPISILPLKIETTGLGPSPPIFSKLLKVSMTVLHSMDIKIIIYLDYILLIGHSSEEMRMSQDILIFHLGFIINWKSLC